MNRKTLILIVFPLILIFFILILLVNNKPKTANPTIISTPTPTTSQVVNVPGTSSNELVLVAVNPAPDPKGVTMTSPIERITFTFNKSVDPSSLQITTNPQINLEKVFLDNSKQLIIQPEGLSFWKPNVLYTITIKNGLKSTDDFILKEDILYSLQAIVQGGE